MPSDFIQIYINRQLKIPLFRQVYEKIRDHILTGVLKTGARLPSTRYLANELAISRNVVMEAYDQLHAEGYIESCRGSYTRVAQNTVFYKYLHQKAGQGRRRKKIIQCDVDFRTGIPDLKRFPKVLWGKYLKKAVGNLKESEFGYFEPEGQWGLREVLSRYLYRIKGIKVIPDQIVITSGATQALSLAAGILYKNRCKAVIEDPGGYGVANILVNAGYGLSPADTGANGILPSSIRLTPQTRMIYLTPSHQFPMGSILPAAQRIELLEQVQDKDIFIVEDDYDSEFRYNGAPIHPLKALDPEKVIYIGSFSKVLSPGLRMGYTVLPSSLVEKFKQKKRFSDAQSPVIDQIALKNFIQDGLFEKHVYRMKKVYKRKRDVLINILTEEFGDSIQIYGENAGLHLVVQFLTKELPYDNRFEICHNKVLITSVEKHAIRKGHHRDKLIFGYGHLSENDIINGIKKLNKFR